MREIIARKIVNEKGEEIIELDLNKGWPRSSAKYASMMSEMESMSAAAKKRKTQKEFITLLN
jgi:hypothetical protein